MKRILSLIAAVGLIVLHACKPEPYLTVSPDSLTFNESGGSQTVQVSANNAWSASVSGSGFTVSPSSGEGSGTVTVTAAAASSPDAVSGTLTVRSEGLSSSVSLKQDAKSTIVLGNPARVPASGGAVRVDIQYNVDYTVEVESSARSWIRFIGTKALTSGKLEFEIAANDGDERSGKVTVKDPSGKVSPLTVTIVQNEKAVLKVGEPNVVPATGGSVEIPVEYNTDYKVEVEDAAKDWIRVVRTKALSSGRIELYISENTGGKRSGKVTVTDLGGGVSPIVLTIVQDNGKEQEIRSALMQIYEALDGPNWNLKDEWSAEKDLDSWQGVSWNAATQELQLGFNGDFAFKGEFPDCFEGLSSCVRFWVQEQPGLTGTLPPSFAKLKNLKSLAIERTSMTSLPEIFSGMPLGDVTIIANKSMTGTMPQSLGESDGFLSDELVLGIYEPGLWIGDNGFTGTVPASWLRLGSRVNLYPHRLDGQIPDSFYSADNAAYWISYYINSVEPGDSFRASHPFSVKDADIPGYWPEKELDDVITGEPIPYDDIISRNKATVIFRWASWCGYSAALLPLLRRMHEKYHDDGLEVIAYPAWGDSEGLKMQKEYVKKNGYDIWYNFSSDNLTMTEESAIGSGSMPFVNIIDNDGNIIFSCSKNVSDPSRNRFNHVAYFDLIPALEDMFGPLEDGEEYTSTDYSRDGTVYTLQTASVGKGINVVFMGDAYTDRDINDGTYDWMMQQSMEALFSIEPYKTFRDRFNVYAVRVVSRNGRTGDGYSTALGARVTRESTVSGSEDKCFEYALKVPAIKSADNLLIGVMVNSVYDGGICLMSESHQSGVAFYSSFSNEPDGFGPVLRHEAGGHGFAFLADEYATQDVSVDEEYVANTRRVSAKYGWSANVDFTDDPEKVKWSAFLSDSRYKDEVGIFEGAANVTKGIYRPSFNSMMNQKVEYFNAPSRWAIYKRIMELSGEEASFEKFLEYDAVNRGGAKAAAARVPLKAAAAPERRFTPLAPPVIVP